MALWKRIKKVFIKSPAPETEVFKVYRNGKLYRKITLTPESPQLLLYYESVAAAAELTAEKAEAAYLEHSITFIINNVKCRLEKLAELDLTAAKRVSCLLADTIREPDRRPRPYETREI